MQDTLLFFKDILHFNNSLERINISFDNNEKIERKLLNSIFYHDSQNTHNSSFYLITSIMSDIEFDLLRKHIWNKNNADIIFYRPNNTSPLEMYYAKCSPLIKTQNCELDKFFLDGTDEEKIENIRQWNFDNGVFWLKYSNSLKKIKTTSIDKELVNTLKTLKELLSSSLQNLITDLKTRSNTVQALIDRTLYIKYLEDNHIINSYFYNFYFNSEKYSFKQMLLDNNTTNINKLFSIIHEIFNNSLFHEPEIDEAYLITDVCNLIANSFDSQLNSGQLKLFDFQFNVLPVELISFIYELFLSDIQKDNGIYYTPKKLAQLIVDDVINEDRIGSVLDPACGSGMLLITAYQRLLEIAQKKGLEPTENIEKIRFRTKLLYDNIFGIEKEHIAKRFTQFSLSLQIFREIPPDEIRIFIATELEQKNKITLFTDNNFYHNIIHRNALDCLNSPFNDRKFDYIIGNPPFFKISNSLDNRKENDFLEKYKICNSNGGEIQAREIIGSSQISQAFMLKIKDWANTQTRFGFVQNSSNFYNENSDVFVDYFYSNYGIEKIYDLSKVKNILFDKAKESVLTIIFNNNVNNNDIKYYSVEPGVFSEKPFNLLIVQENKAQHIKQNDLKLKRISLRDLLIADKYDFQLKAKLTAGSVFKDFSTSISRGVGIWGETAGKNEYELSKNDWRNLDKDQKNNFRIQFVNKYFKNEKSETHNNLYLYSQNLSPFIIKSPFQFVSTVENCDRPRVDKEKYSGEKLLFLRSGNELKCCYYKYDCFFDFTIYTCKLHNSNLYYLFQAILNSDIVRYYLNLFNRKRIFDSYPRIGIDDIENIPIPKYLDDDLVNQISELSKALSEGKYEYRQKQDELNELIYDLYDLNFLERQRVKDYLIENSNNQTTEEGINTYTEAIRNTIEMYFSDKFKFETHQELGLRVVKIDFNININPTAKKATKYILEQLFDEAPDARILYGQEIIIGKDCIYIVKQNIIKNWTITKAFEDGQYILKSTKQ